MGKAKYSRNGKSSVFGKRERDMGKLLLEDDPALKLMQAANEVDLPVMEFVRNLIYIRLYGVEELLSLNEKKIRSIAKTGIEKGCE